MACGGGSEVKGGDKDAPARTVGQKELEGWLAVGAVITRGSALPAPKGAINKATTPAPPIGGRGTPLEHRLHLYQLEEKIGRQPR